MVRRDAAGEELHLLALCLSFPIHTNERCLPSCTRCCGQSPPLLGSEQGSPGREPVPAWGLPRLPRPPPGCAPWPPG